MPAEDLDLTTETRAESTVIHVAGELDLSTVPRFDAELEQASTGGRVVIVLADCTFIDSSALQSLVRAQRIVSERGGAIALVAPSQPARRVLEVAALDRFIPVFATLDVALAATDQGRHPQNLQRETPVGRKRSLARKRAEPPPA